MTTGVPSGSRASACRVCPVACRQPALVGHADRLARRRSAVDGQPVAAAPPRGQPRLVPGEHDDAAPEPPPAPGDLVGDVEAPGRRRRARSADRDASPEEHAAVLAQRQQALREIGLDRVPHRAEPDGRGAGYPADDAVPQDVALHGEPVAAPADDLEPPHRAEGRLPARDGERPASGRPPDRHPRLPVDDERHAPGRPGPPGVPHRRHEEPDGDRPGYRKPEECAARESGVRHRWSPSVPPE